MRAAAARLEMELDLERALPERDRDACNFDLGREDDVAAARAGSRIATGFLPSRSGDGHAHEGQTHTLGPCELNDDGLDGLDRYDRIRQREQA